MKQRLTILAMVVLVTILIASPVLAAGSNRITEVAKKWGKPTIISMTGTIVDLAPKDADTGMIRISIRMTNRAFIQYRGATVWVIVDLSTTKIFIWDGTTRSSWSYDKLSINDKVSINARLSGGEFKARRVQVSQPRIPQ